jgi:hypothetical protein
MDMSNVRACFWFFAGVVSSLAMIVMISAAHGFEPQALAAQAASAPGGKPGLIVNSAPVVPPIAAKMSQWQLIGDPKNPDLVVQELDGIDCNSCTFRDVTLKYSGGALQLANTSFAGQIRIDLAGPAANTVAFLKLLHSIHGTGRSPVMNPDQPVVRTAGNEVVTVNFQAAGLH